MCHLWLIRTASRYLYAEGMKLVKRYEEEEAELADKLKVGRVGGWAGSCRMCVMLAGCLVPVLLGLQQCSLPAWSCAYQQQCDKHQHVRSVHVHSVALGSAKEA
jgi:hypothetical protein